MLMDLLLIYFLFFRLIIMIIFYFLFNFTMNMIFIFMVMVIRNISHIIIDFLILFHYYVGLELLYDIFTFFHLYFIETYS